LISPLSYQSIVYILSYNIQSVRYYNL